MQKRAPKGLPGIAMPLTHVPYSSITKGMFRNSVDMHKDYAPLPFCIVDREVGQIARGYVCASLFPISVQQRMYTKAKFSSYGIHLVDRECGALRMWGVNRGCRVSVVKEVHMCHTRIILSLVTTCYRDVI